MLSTLLVQTGTNNRSYANAQDRPHPGRLAYKQPLIAEKCREVQRMLRDADVRSRLRLENRLAAPRNAVQRNRRPDHYAYQYAPHFRIKSISFQTPPCAGFLLEEKK